MAEADLAWYVYCVIAAGEQPPFEDVRGVNAGYGIALTGDQYLSAVVTQVSLDEFGEEPLKRNFEDMAWLERTARLHQSVLDRALERSPAVVPMRLCTIFGDEEHLRGMLERERDVLLGALERVRDHSEWSVKLLADPEAIDAAARAQSAAAAPKAAGGAGRAYLARKQAERGLRERSRELVEVAQEQVHARLQAEAEAVALLPPQNRELSGRSGDMVLNAAYLVHRSRVETFTGAVEELRHDPRQRELGLELEVTGPWAPYNFVAAEQPA